MDKNEKDTNRNINIYLSWIIVILLIIVCIITSFYSGKVFYTGSIADDTQKLSVVTGLDNSVYETSATYSISVVPAYNGEDLGTFKNERCYRY